MNASEKNANWGNTTFYDNYSQPGIFQRLWNNGKWEIPLYSTIFSIAVMGNMLVIFTLCSRKRTDTITNVFLLNLAASDLVLTVLCMPFTLIGSLLHNFIFGKWLCKIVPFLQATSVAASVWTMVALSVERYYAICHPLRSRKWQTVSHAKRLVAAIWTTGAIFMLPVLYLTELQPMDKGRHKCRENWPSVDYEKAYNVILDLILFAIPLSVLGITYHLIASTLRKDLKERVVEMDIPTLSAPDVGETSFTEGADEGNRDSASLRNRIAETKTFMRFKRRPRTEGRGRFGRINRNYTMGLRRTNYEMTLLKKQRAIKMLYLVVLEFFICWTPLYVINTLTLFLPETVYSPIGYKIISFCQLLAYSSGCCNPITYCFMNKTFRSGFTSMFSCFKPK